jgi:hypothetical protein
MNRTSKKIADSWPASIDDHQGRLGWKHEFDLEYDGWYVGAFEVVFLNITSKSLM